MITLKYFLSLTVLFLSISLNAQIITDRPDQTESANCVPAQVIQLEMGVSGEFNNDIIKTSTNSFDLLLRYGLLDNFEFRLIWDYTSEKDRTNDFKTDGLGAMAIGTKIHIKEEGDGWPEIAFLGHLSLPYFGEDDFTPPDVEPDFRLSLSHTLSDKLGIGYNLGMGWAGQEEFGIYTCAVGYALTDHFGVFGEVYGFVYGDSNFDNRIDGGFTYLLNKNLQLDISGGLGLSDISPDGFISLGVSWRSKGKED